MNYDTIKVRVEGQVCYLQLYRPEAGNTINDRLVEECSHALAQCEESASVIVLEGMDGIFCTGADFKGIHAKLTAGSRWGIVRSLCMPCGRSWRQVHSLRLPMSEAKRTPEG